MDIGVMILACEQAGKRIHQIGNSQQGVLVVLDMEARVYTYVRGKIVNRVNLLAIGGQSTKTTYLNPGGDGLWPAPEGTSLGYQYATEGWRVPAGIRFARYQVVEIGEKAIAVEAEIDLVNNQGVGIPTVFRRDIRLDDETGVLTVRSCECITYVGDRVLRSGTFLLAPWTLCQFDCDQECQVIFPGSDPGVLWDLYEETIASAGLWDNGYCRIPTDGTRRFQIGLGKAVPWIEFHNPRKGLVVRREAEIVSEPHQYIDIRDAAPVFQPDPRGIRYSVYADPSGFMEIEAVGGCLTDLFPGTELKVSVSTTYYY